VIENVTRVVAVIDEESIESEIPAATVDITINTTNIQIVANTVRPGIETRGRSMVRQKTRIRKSAERLGNYWKSQKEAQTQQMVVMMKKTTGSKNKQIQPFQERQYSMRV